ncbi:hypothetical protein CC86DRAFT_402717 [Ophiobolus disseminans]|uniref:Uncharacterized protein n=1 Tax=Ophiobolus disseminans TaxID=1469910 RepID=A0A6A7ABT3_9PLEO|nr:hypothetical protein CC86DRAFT_402717 [Ophiobolus disseminans]
MRVTNFLTTLALVASTAFAATNTLANHCDHSVWYTQVGGDQQATLPVEISPGESVDEAQFFLVSGTAIKFTKAASAESVLQFAYSYQAGVSIYYSLDNIGDFDYLGKKITLKGNGSPSIVWNGNVGSTRTQAFLGGEKDLTFTLCA